MDRSLTEIGKQVLFRLGNTSGRVSDGPLTAIADFGCLLNRVSVR